MTRRLLAVLLLCLLLPLAAAGGGGGGGGKPAPGPKKPTPDPEPPPSPTFTTSQYRHSVVSGSSSSASIDAWTCAVPAPGIYTIAYASATTSAGYPSSYFAHNVRLYVNGRLEARSADVSQTVVAPGPTNGITSIPPIEVSKRLSCPVAFVAKIEARGWHKAISILGHSVTLDTYSEWRH